MMIAGKNWLNKSEFQSLPGNLGVPAQFSGSVCHHGDMFQSLPGNLGVPAAIYPTSTSSTLAFQSLPGNLGVPAIEWITEALEHGIVSIPSREFGSSGF